MTLILLLVDEEIPATDETPAIPVRIYTPRDSHGELPLIVFFHGGGYISGIPVRVASLPCRLTPSGNIRTEEPHCRIIAARTPAIVVNVDYPLRLSTI